MSPKVPKPPAPVVDNTELNAKAAAAEEVAEAARRHGKNATIIAGRRQPQPLGKNARVGLRPRSGAEQAAMAGRMGGGLGGALVASMVSGPSLLGSA